MQKRKTRDDGKTPEQRSAAAKKAAATRKANLEKGRGDITKISIDVPKKLSDEQEQAIRKLAELELAHVTPHRKSFLDTLKGYFVIQDQSS